MGATQGTPQLPPPQETRRRTRDEVTICSLCFSRYDRRRQSVCTCNHCSLPLCSDCMRDHIDELPKNITQLSHQLHQLEEIFRLKQHMVDEEVATNNTEIKQCFKNYQNELLEAHQTIIVDVEKAKHDAKEYLNKIFTELQTIEGDIETLSRETIFQPARMEALLNQLQQIQDKLQNYEITKDTQLEIVLPKYTLKFQCTPPAAVANETNRLPETESSNAQNNTTRRSNRQHPYQRPPVNVQRTNVSRQDSGGDWN